MKKTLMTRKGFSLIETLISLALSAFLITGTAQLLLQSLRLSQRSEAMIETARLASDLLESLRSLPFDDPALEEGEHVDSVTDPKTRLTFRRRWTIEDVEPAIKDASVTVACESKRVRDVRLRARIESRLGF